MKTNGSLIGGRLIDDPRDLRGVRAVLREVRPGLPARPACRSTPSRCRTSRRTGTPNGYPGTDMPVAQEAKLIEALGPVLRRGGPAHARSSATTTTGPSTPNDVATTPPGEDPETDYPYRAARTARPRSGWPAPRTTATPATRARRPRCTTRSRTRASGSPSAPARTARPTRRRRSSRDTLKWHARNLIIGVTRNWAQDRRQLEPRARPDRRPAQRRLRHLHRRASPSGRTAR